MSDVVEKIRKLLRLAKDKGATESEANVALEMAQRLMLQHNIKDVEEKREVHAVKGEWMHCDRGQRWELWIAGSVAKLFNCRVVQLVSLGAHQFVGKPENIEVAGETFLWVCGQVEALYKEALRTYGRSLGRQGRADLRRSFKEACASRINQRVNEIVAAARNSIPDHMALVVIDQSLAAASELIANVPSRKSRPIRHGIGTVAGYEAGNRVQLQGHVPGSNGKPPARKMIG